MLAALLSAPLLLMVQAAAPLPGPIPAEVGRVLDGDTIEVRAFVWPGMEALTRVRLIGVDAPETWRPGCPLEAERGAAATEFLRTRAGETVTLREVRIDSFGGRVLARVMNADGEDLSDALLAAGHAVPYRSGRDWCED